MQYIAEYGFHAFVLVMLAGFVWRICILFSHAEEDEWPDEKQKRDDMWHDSGADGM